MLALAKQVQAELVRRGYEVAFTRNGDQTVDLSRRPALAEQWRADVFVSLHANYVGTSSVRGVETFRLTPKDTLSSYGENTNSITRPGNACDRRNARLAYEVQKALTGGTGAPDRGVRQANFQVLREASCPAILIETGFMSNSQEERLLGSAAYRAKIAGGIADGIDRYRQAVAHQP
jgi:N-acetylmuramoyl-L-alanine amidase